MFKMDLLTFFCIVGSLSLTLATELERRPKTREVDIIFENLAQKSWSEEEKACFEDFSLLLNNVKNHTLWAVWIWNSIPRPTGLFYGSKHNLGSYDQCLQAPIRNSDPKFLTQYCLVEFKLTKENLGQQKIDLTASADKYISSQPNKIMRDLTEPTWGVCMPASCQPPAISKIVHTIYAVNPMTATEPVITVNDCTVAGIQTVYNRGFYLFIAISVFLITMAFISTFCVGDSKGPGPPIIHAFCMKRNFKSLFTAPSNDMVSLHYLKTASIIFITCIHVGFFKLPLVSNGLAVDEIFEVKNLHDNMIQRSDIVISNYLLISSILLMRSLMDKRSNPVQFLISRYFRLIGSFVLMLLYTTSVLMHTGDGPLWNKYAGREQKACEENWWLSLMMMNNYINGDNICQPISWHLQCDYHLAAMGVVLFCLWQKNKSAGKILASAIFLAGILAPGINTYWNNLPGTLVFNNIDKLTYVRTSDVYVKLYMRSQYRIAPFLIGMAMGYIMSTYKPEKNRLLIPKEWSVAAILVSNIIALRTVTAAASWCLQEYNPWDASVYAALNNVIWTLAMCINIAVIEYGDLGSFFTKFVQFPGFFYISRLGYGIYLSHALIVQRNFFSTRDTITFDVFSTAVEGFGVLLISSLISVLLWLFVDGPLGNLTGLTLKKIFKTADAKKEVPKEEYNACFITKNKVI